MNRREFLRLGAGTLAMGVLAGCTPPPTQPQASAAPQGGGAGIKRGGTLIESTAFTYATLDQHLTSTPVGTAYSGLYDCLLRYEMVDEKSGRFAPSPGLAESWTQEGPKALVMQLRKGVKFHDNSDFNAEVAKWNIDRMRTEQRSEVRAVLTPIESVDVLGGHSIRLNLKAPAPSLLVALSHGFVNGKTAMLSRAAMERLGQDGFARNPVGTGPMRFKQWITDDRVVLERTGDYWMQGADGKPLPYVDQLVSRYVPDPSVALLELRSRSIHLLDAAAPKDVAAIKGDPNLIYWEMPWAGVGYFTVSFNYKSGPFSNLKLRQAALYATDRDSMARTIAPDVGRPYLYPRWLPGSLGYDESIPAYRYDLDKAKQLVREAGHASGVEVNLLVISREPENTIGQMAAEMWGKAGIKTKLGILERLAWIDAMAKGNFDAGFSRISPEADSDMQRQYVYSGGAANRNDIREPEVDRLMDEAGSTYDTEKRHELYKRVVTLLQEKAYMGSGFLVPEHKVIRKEVKGLKAQGVYPDPRTAWLDL